MKRLFDVLISLGGLILTAPLLIPVCVLIWSQDFASPFYIAPRVGKNSKIFKMVKLRSMVNNADKSGVDSTGANDRRITPIGKFVRSYKLDELAQLWNVLKGDMSLVGPRPNVQREVNLYTEVELGLLSVRPGITDISSIVFSDEGEILKDSQDPDLDYNQLIRPWKSRLGLFYVENSSLALDLKLIFLTVVAIISREKALAGVQNILNDLGADERLKKVAKRQEQLTPCPPPGAREIVMSR
ncbi:sugar transferase [Microcoleus sp. FACHB-SPT15]|uniref:sugar transferase n=1 Tax=Microcoleus sp. FACHB-SPT15 TaxID=2692830 RepID=UPI0017859AFB|nr:sugar transferase [Microcoleus sp. FACHB-SPT15]MBD1806570.1 sugar transferase [Microcoleus sp. FACHB-SPT15]